MVVLRDVYVLPPRKYFVTSPHIPLHWQRGLIPKIHVMTGSNPGLYGLPKPNHKFFEAHPTQSVELPLRLGSGDITPKGDVARLDARDDPVHDEPRAVAQPQLFAGAHARDGRRVARVGTAQVHDRPPRPRRNGRRLSGSELRREGLVEVEVRHDASRG